MYKPAYPLCKEYLELLPEPLTTVSCRPPSDGNLRAFSKAGEEERRYFRAVLMVRVLRLLLRCSWALNSSGMWRLGNCVLGLRRRDAKTSGINYPVCRTFGHLPSHGIQLVLISLVKFTEGNILLYENDRALLSETWKPSYGLLVCSNIPHQPEFPPHLWTFTGSSLIHVERLRPGDRGTVV